jgi:hypothetical protein
VRESALEECVGLIVYVSLNKKLRLFLLLKKNFFFFSLSREGFLKKKKCYKEISMPTTITHMNTSLGVVETEKQKSFL